MSGDWEHDVRMASVLLGGFITEDDRGLSVRGFPEKGSHEEREAWKSLARVLRSDRPIPAQLREMLAATCDPDMRSDELFGERRLHIENRSTNLKNSMRMNEIVQYAYNLRKSGRCTSDAKAFEETAAHFGFEDGSTVKKYWYRLKWAIDGGYFD